MSPNKKVKKKFKNTSTLGQPLKSFDPLQILSDSEPSDLQPDGDLHKIFKYGGDSTDSQRYNKLMEIKGAIVQWSLLVYNIRLNDDEYIVITSVKIGSWLFGKSVVGTEIHLSPRDGSERKFVEKLRAGDKITFKGRIRGLSLPRAIEINPAILV